MQITALRGQPLPSWSDEPKRPFDSLLLSTVITWLSSFRLEDQAGTLDKLVLSDPDESEVHFNVDAANGAEFFNECMDGPVHLRNSLDSYLKDFGPSEQYEDLAEAMDVWQNDNFNDSIGK